MYTYTYTNIYTYRTYMYVYIQVEHTNNVSILHNAVVVKNKEGSQVTRSRMYIFPTADRAEHRTSLSVTSLSMNGSCPPDLRAAKTIQLPNENTWKFSVYILAPVKR